MEQKCLCPSRLIALVEEAAAGSDRHMLSLPKHQLPSRCFCLVGFFLNYCYIFPQSIWFQSCVEEGFVVFFLLQIPEVL